MGGTAYPAFWFGVIIWEVREDGKMDEVSTVGAGMWGEDGLWGGGHGYGIISTSIKRVVLIQIKNFL